MKLSEMKAQKTGLPEGFSGIKKKWDEVGEPFAIVRACMRRSPVYNEDGSVMTFSQGTAAGKTVYDRQAVLQIKTDSGKDFLIYTNSPRLVSLFREDEEKTPDCVNIYGAECFVVDVPEGRLRFTASRMEYKNGTVGNVADLEEVDG